MQVQLVIQNLYVVSEGTIRENSLWALLPCLFPLTLITIAIQVPIGSFP